MMKIIDQGIFFLEIENFVACMSFNPTNIKYPKDLVDSSFQRECRNLDRFKHYIWSPEILEIDTATKRIFFKWYNNIAEDYLPKNYEKQLERITMDLHKEKLYKPNYYQKCFYTDDKDQMHTYIFYSTSDYSEQPMSMNFYKPVLNEDRLALVEKLSVNGKLDMSILIKHAFNEYIKWPGDPLPKIYKSVYE